MKIETVLDRSKLDHDAPGKVHLMVGLTPPEITEAKRKPIDVVVALDTSGSMDDPATTEVGGPTKMKLAKEAVRKFVEQLQNGDRVGIVTFETSVQVLVPLRELTAEHRTKFTEQVASLSPGGSTDLVGGAVRALSLLDECKESKDRTRRVILFTDGLPTAGITGHGQVMAAIEKKLDKRTPISTLGFGAGIVPGGAGDGGYDPELLTSIAKMAGGEFYHASGPDGILAAFALELGALRSAAETGVKVEVKPSGKVTVQEVLNDCTVETKDGTTTIDVGHLYGGEPYYLVLALDVPKVEKIFPRDVLACTIRVTGVETASGNLDDKRDVHFRYVKAEEADTTPNPAVEEQKVRLMAARAVEEAYNKARAGDYDGAMRGVRRVAILAMAVGTDESMALAGGLEEIAGDVGDELRFARRGGSVRSAATSLGNRRGSNTGYGDIDRTYTSSAKGEATRHMGVKSSSSPSAPSKPSSPPSPRPAFAPPRHRPGVRPDPKPSQTGSVDSGTESQSGPDKRRSRTW